MSWAYERLDELVESGEMSEEEARQEYREWITEQIITESEERYEQQSAKNDDAKNQNTTLLR